MRFPRSSYPAAAATLISRSADDEETTKPTNTETDTEKQLAELRNKATGIAKPKKEIDYDLVGLGGLIMGARNMSELGTGLAGLAERRQAREDALKRAIRRRKGRSMQEPKSGMIPRMSMEDKLKMEQRRRLMMKRREPVRGMLIGGQAKLDKNKNGRIDAQDFKILKAEKHPDADKLKVCDVDVGKENPVKVVCGAPNAIEGLLTIYAPPGSVIPKNQMKLVVSKIRGVSSYGMLCSESELNLSDESDGITELSSNDFKDKIGDNYFPKKNLNVIDISITPNRPDCLGVRGIARDLAAAKLALKNAIESQNVEAQIAAQEQLANLTVENARLNAMKIEDAEVAKEKEVRVTPQQQQQPQQQADPRAEEWASKNTWFGNDTAMTYTAFDIHKKLVEEEGYDPKSEEYYEEVDSRIRVEFPHKFDKIENTSTERAKPAQTVASANRSAKSGRKKTVKLSPSQVAIAKRIGVPLEEYAKQVNNITEGV